MIAVQTNNLARTTAAKDFETARGFVKQAIAAATAIDADQWLAVFQSDMGETSRIRIAWTRPKPCICLHWKKPRAG